MKTLFSHLFSPHVFMVIAMVAIVGLLDFLPHQFAGASGTLGTVLTIATGAFATSHVVATARANASTATPLEQQVGKLLAQLGEDGIRALAKRYAPASNATPSESTGWTEGKENPTSPATPGAKGFVKLGLLMLIAAAAVLVFFTLAYAATLSACTPPSKMTAADVANVSAYEAEQVACVEDYAYDKAEVDACRHLVRERWCGPGRPLYDAGACAVPLDAPEGGTE